MARKEIVKGDEDFFKDNATSLLGPNQHFTNRLNTRWGLEQAIMRNYSGSRKKKRGDFEDDFDKRVKKSLLRKKGKGLLSREK